MDIKWRHDDPEGMALHRKHGLLWLSFPSLDREDWLKNGFSTRFGGVSRGDQASMNLSYSHEENAENVRENFRRIAAAIGFPPEKLVCTAQTHTTNVMRVGSADCGRGFSRERGWSDVDGLITDEPGVVLATFYADCVPLYFVDPEHRAIGLSHSGWKGTAAKMGKVTIERMTKEFGSDPAKMKAAIGPSICQSCYEVSEDVARQFPNCFAISKGNGKYLLDLQGANRAIMAEAGIPVSQIQLPNLCTCCNPDLLFSHRATKGKRGGMAAFLEISAS